MLWQNKGLVAAGAALLAFVVLFAAYEVQSARLKSAKADRADVELQRDIAIEAHDRLAEEYTAQRQALIAREDIRKQQEAENAKLRTQLAEALRRNRQWADALVPPDIIRLLQTVPEGELRPAPTATGSDTDPAILRSDKRRPTLLGDLDSPGSGDVQR